MHGERKRTRYKAKHAVMAERQALGRCDTCGGPTREIVMAGKPTRICDNGGVCGFHEVGVRDGARFYAYHGAEKSIPARRQQ